jgi:hypothetical protein
MDALPFFNVKAIAARRSSIVEMVLRYVRAP